LATLTHSLMAVLDFHLAHPERVEETQGIGFFQH
jgi:hypothetical protein